MDNLVGVPTHAVDVDNVQSVLTAVLATFAYGVDCSSDNGMYL